VRRDLEWPRPSGELDHLWETWSPFATDYEIISWTDGTPEELVEARAHLSAIMPTEAPHVDIDSRPNTGRRAGAPPRGDHAPDGSRPTRRGGRHRASGELVGYSELTVSRDQPKRPISGTRWSFVATGVTDSAVS